jgi:hypothetical protein
VPDGVVEEQHAASASPTVDPSSHLLPQLGALLAGTVQIDLRTLGRAADEFFARLEALTEDIATSPAHPGVTEWVVAAAVAAGALDFARRRANRLPDPSWHLSGLLLAPEDAP